jgi:alpha-L-fucosidase
MKSDQEISEKKYESNWESLNTRPCPEWFANAKFGIFISWGLFSVPAYKPDSGYAEWIGHPGRGWMNDPFIKANFGENVVYDDFANQFKAELYDPHQWAELIQKSGAKYVFLTAKYHDGFCLWPSSYATNGKTNSWHAGSMGPKRDLIGPFCDAMRAKGLFTGLYYSLHEWFHPLCGNYTDDFFYCKEPERFAREHMHPQFKEMVNLYKPDLIFADGDTISPEKWSTAEMIAWLYNESPVKDKVVLNDRCGFWTDEKYGRGKIGDYYTTEYGFGLMLEGSTKPWEESRGMGTSYGYNRRENIEVYASSAELIATLIEIVSKGGNLALDIGPTADGRIPVIMQERLLDIGAWLAINGEAIYGTRKWLRPNKEGDTSFQVSNEDFKFDGTEIKPAITNTICFTQKDNQIFVICVGWPGTTIEFEPDSVKEIKRISLLGLNEDISWRFENGLLKIQVPQLTIDKLPCSHAWSFKIETN